jgi:preprotein translocase subunit SecY
MAASILNMFRVEDLRNKVLFTLGMLALYRVGCFVPAPGIDIDAIQLLKESTDENGGALAFLRLFSGGALTQFAIFALGIMPYITASIIMQILGCRAEKNYSSYSIPDYWYRSNPINSVRISLSQWWWRVW